MLCKLYMVRWVGFGGYKEGARTVERYAVVAKQDGLSSRRNFCGKRELLRLLGMDCKSSELISIDVSALEGIRNVRLFLYVMVACRWYGIWIL